ncbi:MAG TPA: MaoC family dehydratase [Actinomycetota bacterium]
MTRIDVGGPWFEDLKVGQVFDDAPPITITPGHTAMHQALFGDRMRLPLDAPLARAVTGRAEMLVHPNLVCNIAIGQTTVATQRVRGNLFYRGLILQRPVMVGDTLHTTTEVVGLKQNRRRAGKPATGLVALRMTTLNQHGNAVVDCWRCPMIPLRDPEVDTGHADRFDDEIPADLDARSLARAVPPWRLEVFRERAPGSAMDLDVGTTYVVEAQEPVSGAPELVRMTMNVAMVHLDASASSDGRRLVYGGHTISIAGAQLTRAFPNLVTLLAWRSCDHLAPVFEGDLLRSEATIHRVTPLDGGGGMVDLHVITSAVRADGDERVLDWRPVGLMP